MAYSLLIRRHWVASFPKSWPIYKVRMTILLLEGFAQKVNKWSGSVEYSWRMCHAELMHVMLCAMIFDKEKIAKRNLEFFRCFQDQNWMLDHFILIWDTLFNHIPLFVNFITKKEAQILSKTRISKEGASMSRHKILWVISLLVSTIFSFPNLSLSAQERRLALLIGNSNYTHGGNLDNPVNDVRAIKRALESLAFAFLKYENLAWNLEWSE